MLRFWFAYKRGLPAVDSHFPFSSGCKQTQSLSHRLRHNRSLHLVKHVWLCSFDFRAEKNARALQHECSFSSTKSCKNLMNSKFKAQSLNQKYQRKFTFSWFSVTFFKHVGLLWPISALDRKQVRGYVFFNGRCIPGLILGLRPANERRRYFVTTSLIGWEQSSHQSCNRLMFFSHSNP